MEQKQDWSKTDDLVAKLRAKINEEQQMSPPMEGEEAQEHSPEPAQQDEAERILSAAFENIDQAVREDVTPPKAAPKGRKRARTVEGAESLTWEDRVQAPAQSEQKPLVKGENSPEQGAPPPRKASPKKQTARARRASAEPTVAPVKTENEPSAAGNARPQAVGSAPPITRQRPTFSSKGLESEVVPAPTVRTAGEVQRAAQAEKATVESLMQDIFGAAKDEKGNAFIAPTPAEVKAEKKPSEQARVQPLVESVKVIAKEPAASEKIASGAPTEEEVRLLMDLGYEAELGQTIGFERLGRYREQDMMIGPGKQKKRKKSRRDSRLEEFELQGQETYFRRQYAGQRNRHITHFVLSVVLFFIILIYEHPTWIPGLFRGPINGADYPYSYLLVGIQLLILDVMLAWRRLRKGLRACIRLKPIDYSLCSLVLVFTLVYHLLLLLLPMNACPRLYLSPAAMGMSLLLLSDFFDWYREFAAFRVVSHKCDKFALTDRISVGGEAPARTADGKTAGTRLRYAQPVGFVTNYMSNTDRRIEHNRSLGLHLLFACAVGLICGIYTYAVDRDFADALQTLFAAMLFCLPVISLLVTSLPMFLACVMRLGKERAIIGEESVYDCAEQTTLVLPDNEVFEPMSHEQFQYIGGAFAQKTPILVRAVLECINSPLTESVEVDLKDRISAEDVRLEEIADDGICATVKQSDTVLIGRLSYLHAKGVALKQTEAEQARDDRRVLLAVAVNGHPCAIFLARYRLNKKTLFLFEELREEGVRLAVRTKDPGINEETITTLQPDQKNRIAVIKPCAQELDLRTDRVDSTIVAHGSCSEAAKTFLICRLVRKAGVFGRVLQSASVVFGAMIALLVTIFGNTAALSPLLITFYIFAWCAAQSIGNYLYLRDKENL